MTVQRSEARVPVWTRGDRLRKARLELGLNTREFAQLIGVSPKTVNNAENDAHDVRKIVLNAWSAATNVPVEWLESGDAPSGGPGGPTSGPAERLARLTEAKRRRTRGPNGSTHQYAHALAHAA